MATCLTTNSPVYACVFACVRTFVGICKNTKEKKGVCSALGHVWSFVLVPLLTLGE